MLIPQKIPEQGDPQFALQGWMLGPEIKGMSGRSGQGQGQLFDDPPLPLTVVKNGGGVNVRVCAAPDIGTAPEGRLSVMTNGEGTILGVRVTEAGTVEPVMFTFQYEKQSVTIGDGVTVVVDVVEDHLVRLALPLTVIVGQATCNEVVIGVTVIVVEVPKQVEGKISWHGGLQWTLALPPDISPAST